MNFDELMRAILFLPKAGTGYADAIDQLHFFVILVTMTGSAAVGLFAVVWLVRYHRRGAPSQTPRVQAPLWFEVAWIGGLLGLFILFWVIGFYQYISYATPPTDAEDVYVTAKQWMWKFAYPNGRSTVGILVVPEGRPVRLAMTSRDVIHSFYVPAFRLKQDVLPGRYTTAWFNPRTEGIFDVYCAEYCGTSHSRMWASIVVLSPEEYDDWMQDATDTPELVARAGTRAALQGWPTMRIGDPKEVSMAERGRKAATQSGCLSCHTIDGQPHIGPTWKGLFGRRVRLESGETVIADEEYLTRSMMEPMADLVVGFQPVMPTYLGTLPQPSAAAIVEFIKSLEAEDVRPAAKLPRTVTIDEGAPPAGAGMTGPLAPTLGEQVPGAPQMQMREPAERVAPRERYAPPAAHPDDEQPRQPARGEEAP